MKRSQAQGSTTFVIYLSLLLLYYLSYRYPFQINFSGTSPTYSDTPLSLQLGKFIIALCGCCYLALRYRTVAVGQQGFWFVTAVLILLAGALLKATTGEQEFLEFVFWPLVAMLCCLFMLPVPAARIDMGIQFLMAISVGVELVQIFLFFAVGRLPALAFEDSVSVRFGSFLDDPNGFAGLCFLLLGWSVYQRSTRARLALGSVSVLMILASQSLTAILFLALASLVIGVASARRSPLPLVGLLLVLGAGAALNWDVLLDALRVVYESKQGSIEEHGAFQLSDVVAGGVPQLLFGSLSYQFYESWWAQALHNYGAIWTAGLGLACLYAIGLLWCDYLHADTPNRGVAFGMLLYTLYFAIGSLNLPFFLIFPNNYVFFGILFLITMRRLQWSKVST